MAKLSTKSSSHRRLSNFVDWIRPEKETEDAIRTQANDIRSRIKAKAEEDLIVVRQMPWSGSFEKKTGLRRHMRGNHEVEGQDIDLPFVISPKTKDGKEADNLLDRFERYAKAIYPNTSRSKTKSSVCLDFKSSKLSYDLVPMLAVEGDDEAQILIRLDGERRQTSVQKHIRFVKARTAESNQLDGRVKFNEVVRLVKWWRELHQSQSQLLTDVPTILIDLLCAKSFDEFKVDETYTETLSRWFGRCANIVRYRRRVDFSNPSNQVSCNEWVVLDPVNSKNNVVPKWGNLEIDELAQWFEAARDGMARVITADTDGDEPKALDELVALFGNAIKDHG